MRTVRSSSVNPSSRIPEIGMPWLVAGSGAGATIAPPAAFCGCDRSLTTKGVDVALGTAVGTALGVMLGNGVALGGGVALAATAWLSGTDGPSSEPTISTYTGLVRTGSASPSKVASAWLTIRAPVATASLTLVLIEIFTH